MKKFIVKIGSHEFLWLGKPFSLINLDDVQRITDNGKRTISIEHDLVEYSIIIIYKNGDSTIIKIDPNKDSLAKEFYEKFFGGV